MSLQLVSFEEAPFEIIDGDRGKNYPKQNEFSTNGFCLFLTTKNVTKNGFSFSECQFISEAKDNSLRKGKLEKEDIVLTTRGTLGNSAYYHSAIDFEEMRINSGMVILRCNSAKISPEYLYCFLRSSQFHEQVHLFQSGVAQPQLPIRDLRKIKFPLPSIELQNKISNFVRKYDLLIENNRRRIELLEESARLLYNEWFVHLRFPGHEHVKIEDGVPEGWSRCDLSNYIKIKHGYAFKGTFFSDEKTNRVLLTPGNVDFGGGIKLEKLKFYSEEGPLEEEYVLEEEDLLLTMTDLSKQTDTLGYSFFVPADSKKVYLHNQRLGKVIPTSESCFRKYFLSYLFRTKEYRGHVVGSATGTSVKHTSPTKILSYQPMIPNYQDSSLIKEFDEYAKEITRQINLLLQMNSSLLAARNLLLPKLMSGELVVT